MRGHPRFQAEYFIWQNVDELKAYSNVFRLRVARAFDGLAEEAEELTNAEFERLGSISGEDDAGSVADQAIAVGAAFFTDTDAVRQGVFNLMTAGLYHLFEQQADRLRGVLPSPPSGKLKSNYAREKLQEVLKAEKIALSSLKNWDLLEALRHVANTVKHGDGKSAETLREKRPELFEAPMPHSIPFLTSEPLHPLIGEGLRLNEDHFEEYATGLEAFWLDLAELLYQVFSPPEAD